jgi:hypothetical protein
MLAGIYPREEDSYRLVDEAGLDRIKIVFSEKAIDNWHNILIEAYQRGKINKLIENIINESQDKELENAYQAYLTELKQFYQTPAGKVTVGFEALVELISLPEVHDTLIVYRAELRRASQQIYVMSNFKELHDLLHDLQVYCSDPITQIFKRLPPDERDWEGLVTLQMIFQQKVDILSDIAGRDTFSGINVPAIQEDLGLSLKQLDVAVQNSDVDKLRRAATTLNRVINFQPSLINLRLNTAVNDLRLPELVAGLNEVVGKITNLDLQLDEAHKFITGVQELERLSNSLTALITEHDKWQSIDLDLRQIEPGLEQSMDDLELLWRRLKAAAQSLYDASTEEWAVKFKVYSEKLDGDISAQNHTAVKESFDLFRRQAVGRFHRVDKFLKALCGDLLKIGSAPLEAVAKALD